MKNIKCYNCESVFDKKLEFCPKCGIFNVEFEEEKKDIIPDYNNSNPQALIEDVVRKMADNINTIKSILVFFTVLWAIGILIWIIILLNY